MIQMIYFMIVLNCVLAAVINIGYYPTVGFVILILSLIMTFLLNNTPISDFFIATQIKEWVQIIQQVNPISKSFMISVACLSLSLKICALIALFVETGAALLIAFSILLAAGYFFEGAASGITAGTGWLIARLLVKVYTFISVGLDRIAGWIAKIELDALGISHD